MQINVINASLITKKASNIRLGSIGQKPNLTSPNDSFVKNIAFGNSYNHDEAINLINEINNNSAKDSGSGFQAKFYKINADYGIKAPNPLYPESAQADICGHNNVKENFALK